MAKKEEEDKIFIDDYIKFINEINDKYREIAIDEAIMINHENKNKLVFFVFVKDDIDVNNYE